jgi:hypothetical protein
MIAYLLSWVKTTTSIKEKCREFYLPKHPPSERNNAVFST